MTDSGRGINPTFKSTDVYRLSVNITDIRIFNRGERTAGSFIRTVDCNPVLIAIVFGVNREGRVLALANIICRILSVLAQAQLIR